MIFRANAHTLTGDFRVDITSDHLNDELTVVVQERSALLLQVQDREQIAGFFQRSKNFFFSLVESDEVFHAGDHVLADRAGKGCILNGQMLVIMGASTDDQWFLRGDDFHGRGNLAKAQVTANRIRISHFGDQFGENRAITLDEIVTLGTFLG